MSAVSLVEINNSEIEAQSNKFSDIIAEIPNMEEGDLIQLFQTSVQADKAFFAVRGQVIQTLVTKAVNNGMEFTSGVKGLGVSAVINELVEVLGVESSTIAEDLKVMDDLGADIRESLASDPDSLLPRIYYVLASRTPLPAKTLDYYREQLDSLKYNRNHAIRDMKKFRDGASVSIVRREDKAERKRAIKAGKKESQLVREVNETTPAVKQMSIRIDATYENQWLFDQVVKKNKGFTKWFTTRAKEEFGDAPPKPEPKPKAKKKAPAKKTAKAKGSAKAKAPARKKPVAKKGE